MREESEHTANKLRLEGEASEAQKTAISKSGKKTAGVASYYCNSSKNGAAAA
jgi:hypothetical protein